MKRRNPYKGVTRVVDRHGKVRWRFRLKGKASCYIHGEFGSVEFEKNYQVALNGSTPEITSIRKHKRGSFNYVIEHYLRTPDYQKLSPIYQRNLALEFERFRRGYGVAMISEVRPHHVEAILAKKVETPAAANKLLKLIRRLARFSIRRGWLEVDPSFGVKGYATNPDGYHTWTDAEIAQFVAHHGAESIPVLALRLILCTGAARRDVVALGWQNIKNGRIEYRRHKTGGEVSLRLDLMPEIEEVIERVPSNQMLFLITAWGKAFTAAGFGNWFRKCCDEAGLPNCSAHGLRKAGATRLANAGATEFEIMAFLGHKTPDEARTYVKAANRQKLTDSALEKLQNVSNRVERLDNHRRKIQKRKGK